MLSKCNTTRNEVRDWAIARHGDQKYGDHPISKHLDDVAEILKRYGENFQLLGYLHDTLEDTDTTYQELEAVFGGDTAKMVSLLTDEPGKNRKMRKERTNAKLNRLDRGDDGDFGGWPALIVKAADRLANLRQSVVDGSRHLKMYKREHEDFRKAVYRRGLCDWMWEEMEEILKGI